MTRAASHARLRIFMKIPGDSKSCQRHQSCLPIKQEGDIRRIIIIFNIERVTACWLKGGWLTPQSHQSLNSHFYLLVGLEVLECWCVGVLKHFTQPYPSCQNTAPQVGRSAVKLQEETLWTTADPVLCPLSPQVGLAGLGWDLALLDACKTVRGLS